LFHAEMKLDFL